MSVTAEKVIAWLQRSAAVLRENKDYLTQLDSSIGDADHGSNMDRGFTAVMDRLPGVADKDAGTILKTVGTTLVSTVGGASGPLYGTAFLRAGTALAGKFELQDGDVLAALQAALEGIMARGKARPGEKTMVDTLQPAIDTFKAAVSLVIVSHSEKLAEGVAELAAQMANGKTIIATAGGAADGSLGTSADKVTAALAQAES